MHIPSSMMGGAICPVTATVSALGISGITVAAIKLKDKPDALRFATVSAFIFAAQMMNFPVHNGTSGHFLGGVLAAALLGIPLGVLAMALVVMIQALVFSDGGLSVLGANVFNMALIGAGLGGFLHEQFVKKSSGSFSHSLAVGSAAWMSVMLAALACSLELAFSGAVPFSKVAGAMMGTHAVIGIGEGLISMAAYQLFAAKSVKPSGSANFGLPFLAAVVIGGILSPFACSFPDGLMSIARKYQLLHETAPAFTGLLSGYTVSLMPNTLLSTQAAGTLGVVITFLFAFLLGQYLKCRKAVRA